MEWIDCKDRLPSRGCGTVAVVFSDSEFGVGWATYWSGARTDFAGWVFPVDELGEGRQVTHWMTLPSPPDQVPE